MFRSTGSYEPDLLRLTRIMLLMRFDPQALTSLTQTPLPLSVCLPRFDPQALTSLTSTSAPPMFLHSRFDPQALTSLTAVILPVL